MDDVIMQILYFVTYYDVYQFCTVDLHYYHLRDKIIKYKQRLSTFPRIGKCKYHIIPKEVIELTIIEYNMDSMMDQLIKCVDKIMCLNLDLVYGDIVELEATAFDQPYQLIYNGTTFEHICYDEHILPSLPIHYKCIDQLVPVDYWFHPQIIYTGMHFPLKMQDIINNITHDNNYWISHVIYNNYVYYVHFMRVKIENCEVVYKKLKCKYTKPTTYDILMPYNHNTLWADIIGCKKLI